jgi:hypothetical protein
VANPNHADDSWMNNPAAISRTVTNSDAFQKYLRLKHLELNLYVFDENYRELKSILLAFNLGMESA